GALSPGQTFVIDMDNGSIAQGATPLGQPVYGIVAWGLKGDDPATDQFSFRTDVQSGQYLFEAPNTRPYTGGLTGVPLTDQGVHCELSFPNAFTWSLSITPLIAGAKTSVMNGTRFGGNLNPLTTLVLGDAGGGTDPTQAVYFNNIGVTVPEPAALGLLA